MISNYLEYLSICGKLAEYQRAYYREEISIIPDEEYDALRKDVIAWENKHPEQSMTSSPAYNVGYIDPGNKKDELRHEYPMLSLENALDADEAQSWINLWKKLYGPEVEIIGEFKYDGMAISLRYMDRVFTRALTRGDGEFGEDVTIHAAKFVPNRIEANGSVEIRGEALITKSLLAYMNNSEDQYANSRNAVAGLLRRNTPNRHTLDISFMPYDIEGADLVFNSYTDKLEVLKQLNFNMQSCFIVKPDDITSLFKTITEIRGQGGIPYDIDGMVFKINDSVKQIELGESNHSPKWAFAYKFPPTIGECTLLDVVFQVGRSGEIAPVAKITATPLMGVVVTSVLMHNEDRMMDRKIAIGNTYEVYRSGDVIPHLGKLIKAAPNAVSVTFPQNCPSCGSPIVKRGATYYCDNTAGCPDQIIAGITYAVSREVLNIDGLAEQTVGLMIKGGLIKHTADLYYLDVAQIAALDGYTDYSADNLVTAIRKSRNTTFDKYITALGIPNVGKSTARKMAHRIHARMALFDLNTPEKVLELKIPDVGPSTAESIASYFSDIQKRTNAIDLYECLSLPEMSVVEEIKGVNERTFVFTGSFDDSRSYLENKILAAGGSIASSVSPKVDYLVVGTNPGSKLRKATVLGIEIIDIRVFLSLFS